MAGNFSDIPNGLNMMYEFHEIAKERELASRGGPEVIPSKESSFNEKKYHLYDEEIADRMGLDDDFKKFFEVRTYPSLAAYNYDQFMKSDNFIPVHGSQVFEREGKCYLKEENNRHRLLFKFPSRLPNQILNDGKIEHISDTRACASRMVLENNTLESLNFTLHRLKSDKKLYGRLDRFVEDLGSKIDHNVGDPNTMPFFKRIFNSGKIARNKKIYNKIDKALKNYGFENLIDYKFVATYFLNSYSASLKQTHDEISITKNNLTQLHLQKDIIENRIVDVVRSQYGSEFPAINQLDKASLVDIYNVNMDNRRILSMKELSELPPYTREEESAKEAATHMLNGTLPSKPPERVPSLEH